MQKHPSVLFIGRFQPFHKGHEKLLSYLAKKYKKIIIVIGSSQARRTAENPFSAQERKLMIKKVIATHPSLKKKISFAQLHDFTSNKEWTKNISRRFNPEKFVVASANPLVRKLLKKAHYPLDASPLFKRAEWVGRKIRQEIRRGRMSSVEKDIPQNLRIWMKQKGFGLISISQS